MSFLLILTVVQRAVGFGRGIWFCRWLDEASLGQWAMAMGFVSLVTPMFLLGLPGSIPRFVETYRQQGQLGSFLKRLLSATAAVIAVGALLIVMYPASVGGFVFGDDSSITLVFCLLIAVLSVVALNVTGEIVRGMRMIRLSSMTQFLQSIAFTLLGLGWLAAGGGLSGLLLMFALATAIGAAPAWWSLLRRRDDTEPSATTFDASAMWSRILPYAAAIWAMNLLSNTFELTDRYMLLHFAEGGTEAGQRAVGQYHSG